MINFERSLALLADEGLVDWSCLLVGLERAWIGRAEVASYALDYLVAHPDAIDEIVQLASVDTSADVDTIKLLSIIITRLGSNLESANELAIIKWRYAILKLTANSMTAPEDIMSDIQYVYSLFDYPGDMAGCNRYGPSDFAIQNGYALESDYSLSPLEALNRVIFNIRNLILQYKS